MKNKSQKFQRIIGCNRFQKLNVKQQNLTVMRDGDQRGGEYFSDEEHQELSGHHLS